METAQGFRSVGKRSFVRQLCAAAMAESRGRGPRSGRHILRKGRGCATPQRERCFRVETSSDSPGTWCATKSQPGLCRQFLSSADDVRSAEGRLQPAIGVPRRATIRKAKKEKESGFTRGFQQNIRRSAWSDIVRIHATLHCWRPRHACPTNGPPSPQEEVPRYLLAHSPLQGTAREERKGACACG